ncbi:response regulator transcription factor [Oscillibacter sp.]|uniref:response regulator transcription factor n=1 Tax=Oscillibacter sp. TaxID=1945593 RepID=UPI00289F0787|nr:response regulator transcription factor [Oscillibacter sp.]
MTNKATILMIEDNLDILRANAAELRMENYRVLEADTLEAGRALAQREHPDLLLLDILLPDGSGLDYCREVFGQNAPRILFLSAMNAPEDVIAGLLAGGDDYMTKPYLVEELLARVQVLLRRPALRRSESSILRAGPLELNTIAGRAYLHEQDLLLTRMEYTLLEYLANNMNKYLSAEELYRKLWDMEAGGDVRTVWEHVSRLRKKLAEGTADIESVRGKGYRLVANRDTANLAKN